MATVTSQQIEKYYNTFRDAEVTFSKEISKFLNLDPRQIYIKCAGGQWPCILNSASFQMARIIVGTKGGAFETLSKAKNDISVSVSVRFCFTQTDGKSLAFFISSHVESISPYMNSADLVVVTLTFIQRPPDDLIEILGNILDANFNAQKNHEEQIVLNDDSKRRLGLTKEETYVVIDKVPRRCILRSLSFVGAKIVLLGISKFLNEKETILAVDFDDLSETINIRGKISSASEIQGRNDICSVEIKFDEVAVPLNYKVHINSYLTKGRKAHTPSPDEQKAALLAKQKHQEIQKRREQIAKENAAKAAAEAQKRNVTGGGINRMK